MLKYEYQVYLSKVVNIIIKKSLYGDNEILDFCDWYIAHLAHTVKSKM